MDILTKSRVLEALCKAAGKWGMYISIFIPDDGPEGSSWNQVPEAATFLNFEEHIQVMADGEGWLLCDSEEEVYQLFYSCVGDDGPTHLNEYNGPVRVYALTCDPQGQLRNENT